jgi:transposase-like protein
VRRSKNSERNRAIYIAFGQGESAERLCKKHGLKPGTLYAIILAEKHRCAFSPLSIYREARNQAAAQLLTSLAAE